MTRNAPLDGVEHLLVLAHRVVRIRELQKAPGKRGDGPGHRKRELQVVARVVPPPGKIQPLVLPVLQRRVPAPRDAVRGRQLPRALGVVEERRQVDNLAVVELLSGHGGHGLQLHFRGVGAEGGEPQQEGALEQQGRKGGAHGGWLLICSGNKRCCCLARVLLLSLDLLLLLLLAWERASERPCLAVKRGAGPGSDLEERIVDGRVLVGIRVVEWCFHVRVFGESIDPEVTSRTKIGLPLVTHAYRERAPADGEKSCSIHNHSKEASGSRMFRAGEEWRIEAWTWTVRPRAVPLCHMKRSSFAIFAAMEQSGLPLRRDSGCTFF